MSRLLQEQTKSNAQILEQKKNIESMTKERETILEQLTKTKGSEEALTQENNSIHQKNKALKQQYEEVSLQIKENQENLSKLTEEKENTQRQLDQTIQENIDKKKELNGKILELLTRQDSMAIESRKQYETFQARMTKMKAEFVLDKEHMQNLIDRHLKEKQQMQTDFDLHKEYEKSLLDLRDGIIANQEDALIQLRENDEKMTIELDHKSKELETLRQTHEAEITAKNNVISQNEQEYEKMIADAKSAHEAEITEKNNVISQNKQEYEKMITDAKRALEQNRNELQIRNDQIRQHLALEKLKVTLLETDIRRMTKQNEQALGDLKEKLNKEQENLLQSKNELTKARESIAELHTSSQKTIEKLTSENLDIKRTSEELRVLQVNQEKEMQNLQDLLSNVHEKSKAEKQRSEEELKTIRKTLQDTTEQFKGMTEDIDKLVEDIEQITTENERLRENQEGRDDALKHNADNIKELQKLISALEDDKNAIDDIMQHLQKLESEKQAQAKQIANQLKTLEDMEQIISEESRKNNDLSALVENMSQQSVDSTNELEKLKKVLLKKMQDSYKIIADNITKQFQELQQNFEDAQTENATLREKVKQLSDQLNGASEPSTQFSFRAGSEQGSIADADDSSSQSDPDEFDPKLFSVDEFFKVFSDSLSLASSRYIRRLQNPDSDGNESASSHDFNDVGLRYYANDWIPQIVDLLKKDKKKEIRRQILKHIQEEGLILESKIEGNPLKIVCNKIESMESCEKLLDAMLDALQKKILVFQRFEGNYQQAVRR